jgi:hypothetical protein
VRAVTTHIYLSDGREIRTDVPGQELFDTLERLNTHASARVRGTDGQTVWISGAHVTHIVDAPESTPMVGGVPRE